MKVLVIGSGGREHALAWKLAQSAGVDEVLVAPGNAGSGLEAGVRNVEVAATDIQGLMALARTEQVDFTVVGPEAPLVLGAVDQFTAAGLPCFGPTQAAAQLEGSKAFSKDFMRRHNIPTAAYASFTDVADATKYIQENGAPIVVKADGLAAGKGVVVAQSEEEAIAAVQDMLSGNGFGEAGHKVVIEEFLQGEEASFICLCDGKTAVPFASSQDHKARDDGDRGPNTGGMGAYSPAPVVTNDVHKLAMEKVINPTLAGMAADGMPYVGFLYAGLMIDHEGQIKVVEFNCRFGDPEAQPVMMRLRADLLPCLKSAVAGTLTDAPLDFDPRMALGVVMAAGGYPGEYAGGDEITGLDKDLLDTKVFHAGTKASDGKVVTAGGRVLCVVGLGESVELAQALAYERVDLIGWRNRYFRKDIGHRAISRS
ncbi:phosphoribosylamine--glycine ligase [bacterium]|jgi:phosphoribosylamine--glycine ligase|nr:phosphoribosylamine--glycine ligase [Gammaproteobacteria bacterium]MDA9999056.1 phosphoribosylamine--glycine ligase [bacterium]MBT3695592.1 phosphoribosylamine--glycine ligase [Gammaproteobacteria bacterium]MBT5332501.1 phosphoribosylamine--glycine ligase [Gammaproteobacteria bacterium]MBT5682894.1 phosphoribosylamine--glycine ligase [Gammaproteobacteria bacterium]|tara:strand:+ start:1489 stop:2766 length:1278 start_codon:yes stop_codon:yes gene_type:complete